MYSFKSFAHLIKDRSFIIERAGYSNGWLGVRGKSRYTPANKGSWKSFSPGVGRWFGRGAEKVMR